VKASDAAWGSEGSRRPHHRQALSAEAINTKILSLQNAESVVEMLEQHVTELDPISMVTALRAMVRSRPKKSIRVNQSL